MEAFWYLSTGFPYFLRFGSSTLKASKSLYSCYGQPWRVTSLEGNPENRLTILGEEKARQDPPMDKSGDRIVVEG